MRSRPTPRLLFLAVALCAHSCIDQQGSTDTPLGVQTESDGAQFTYLATVANGTFARGSNTFSVQIANADGSPGVLTHVDALMPAHGHTATPLQIADRGAGRFDVISLDLLMPGEWQIQLTLSHTGATDDDRATIQSDVP